MSEKFQIVYRYHSGFTLAAGKTLLVFDYWQGENGELTKALTPEEIASYEKVYVFISHEHPDHFDPVVYKWLDLTDVTYIVSYDMTPGKRGRRMSPGDEIRLDDNVLVHAYESTDLGVSFLVTIGSLRVFHAGDLNFWHWREESTVQEIKDAEGDFRRAVAPIAGHPIDIAFFPVDPRQGAMYDAGANYFIMTVKPGVLIPMHFWGRSDLMREFARRSRCADTEVIPLTRSGDRMDVTLQDDGGMDVTVTEARTQPKPPVMPEPADPGKVDQVHLEGYEGGDPFADSDLPVPMEEEKNQENP